MLGQFGEAAGIEALRAAADALRAHIASGGGVSGADAAAAWLESEARRLLDKIEWHYTPKHGSWVNMAETEISIMNGQCLDRRLDSQEKIAAEVATWESKGTFHVAARPMACGNTVAMPARATPCRASFHQL